MFYLFSRKLLVFLRSQWFIFHHFFSFFLHYCYFYFSAIFLCFINASNQKSSCQKEIIILLNCAIKSNQNFVFLYFVFLPFEFAIFTSVYTSVKFYYIMCIWKLTGVLKNDFIDKNVRFPHSYFSYFLCFNSFSNELFTLMTIDWTFFTMQLWRLLCLNAVASTHDTTDTKRAYLLESSQLFQIFWPLKFKLLVLWHCHLWTIKEIYYRDFLHIYEN